MGDRQRLTYAVVAVAVVLASASCKRKQEAENRPPPDHLANGELPLGPDHAYSLPLPRGSQVEYAPDGAFVETPYSAETIANFIRYHVRGGNITVGTSSTQFAHVYVTETPKRLLSIEVRTAQPPRGGSVLTVRDEVGGDPALPPDEHFKRLGLTPDGKLIDPKHMQ